MQIDLPILGSSIWSVFSGVDAQVPRDLFIAEPVQFTGGQGPEYFPTGLHAFIQGTRTGLFDQPVFE